MRAVRDFFLFVGVLRAVYVCVRAGCGCQSVQPVRMMMLMKLVAVGAPLYPIAKHSRAGENLQGLWLSGAPGLRMRICNPGLET